MTDTEQHHTYARLIYLYEQTESLKEQMKRLNKEYKVRKDEMGEVLLTIPGHQLQIAPNFMCAIKTKKRLPGMNNAVVGEGYVAFQQKHGRTNVLEAERDDFLVFIKEIRKMRSETIQEVHCSVI
jgi:hypothetical protein